MERLNNPFVIYGYKGAEYFCDRQKETEAILFTTVSLLFGLGIYNIIRCSPYCRGCTLYLYYIIMCNY